MPCVVPVKFAFSARELYFSAHGFDLHEADHVICTTERGTEIGMVLRDACEMTDAELHEKIGDATLKDVVRIATEEDLAHAQKLAEKGEKAFPIFRQHVLDLELDMKPIGVEYLFGEEQIICYFSADGRIDFRQLVRDLSHEFDGRIDMRQIGVREETALVGGFGHCGQELCCTRFGAGRESISIRMAKDQDLPLNSSKISGMCGRLMCCLRYELEAYQDFKSRAPKKNAVIKTPFGHAKIAEYNTPKEEITLLLENGKQVTIGLAQMSCSQEAQQKAEQNECVCRPDCVEREVLESLESAEVQMALQELDQQNAESISAGQLSQDDLLVDTTRRKRTPRRSTQKDTHMQTQEKVQEKQQHTTRRRHHVTQQAPAQAKHAQTTRRRTHTTKTQPAQPSTSRTRKHTRRPGDKGRIQK